MATAPRRAQSTARPAVLIRDLAASETFFASGKGAFVGSSRSSWGTMSKNVGIKDWVIGLYYV